MPNMAPTHHVNHVHRTMAMVSDKEKGASTPIAQREGKCPRDLAPGPKIERHGRVPAKDAL